MAELRVETAEERDERYKDLLFKGMPMPNGWQLPALIDPPEHSRPDALQRAAQEIQSLIQGEFDSWRRVPFDAGAAIEPGKSGRWGEMAEFGKLDIMQHWVNWEGVSLKDRATSMAAYIDVNLLSPGVRTQLLADANGTSRPPDQDIAAAPHEDAFPAPSRPAGRSPLQHVREELKHWRGDKITAATRPGPWWDHPGWEIEEAGPPQPHLLRHAIDWSGVSEAMQDRILEQWWKPFPQALTREHELNRLVESAGGWGNKEGIERLKNAMLDEAATHMYESTKIRGHLGRDTIHRTTVSDGDGFYSSDRSLTLEGIKDELYASEGKSSIQSTYDLVSDKRQHIEWMRQWGAAVLDAGATTRQGTPSERHGWLIPGNWAHLELNAHQQWLESGGTRGRRADLAAYNLRYRKLAGVDLRRADLRAADFYRADLQGVDFRGADMRGVNLSYADCRGCDFTDAALNGAVLHGTDLRASTLEHADVSALTRPTRPLAASDSAHRSQFQRRDDARGLDR